eukprot:gene9281-biopygen6604
MPHHLLRMNIATAAIELLKSIQRTRHWKWSTQTSAMSNLKAELLNLPLYTDQTAPIDLDPYPEWKAAMRTVTQLHNEEIPEPPPPNTRAEFENTRRELRGHPPARLYRTMTWVFAARSCDIGQLRPSDVVFNDEAPNPATPTVRVSLSLRRGKAARLRGPYPLASHLPREEASVLQQILGRKGPNQLLFSPLTETKDQVRTALRRVNQRLQLPSVRKGTTQLLAENARTDQEVMRLTGHTRVATLQRYTQYGRHPTGEAVTAQVAAGLILLGPSNAATRPQGPRT